jgi:plastocyanin
MRKSTRKLGVLAASAALIATLGASGVSQAAPQQFVAGPLAAFYGKYVTATVVMFQGATGVFRNFDVAPHDVTSNAGLFGSATVGLAKTTPIFGLETLSPGKYGFFCRIHPNMKGTLIVRKKL